MFRKVKLKQPPSVGAVKQAFSSRASSFFWRRLLLPDVGDVWLRFAPIPVM